MISKVPAAPAGAPKEDPMVLASMPASRVPGFVGRFERSGAASAPLGSIELTSDDAGRMSGEPSLTQAARSAGVRKLGVGARNHAVGKASLSGSRPGVTPLAVIRHAGVQAHAKLGR